MNLRYWQAFRQIKFQCASDNLQKFRIVSLCENILVRVVFTSSLSNEVQNSLQIVKRKYLRVPR